MMTIEERNQDIVRRRVAQETFSSIAQTYNVTRQNVHAIYDRTASAAQRAAFRKNAEAARAKIQPRAPTVKVRMARIHVLLPDAAAVPQDKLVEALATWAATNARPPAAPRGGDRIDLNLPADLKARIIERCSAMGVKVSDAVRYAASQIKSMELVK